MLIDVRHARSPICAKRDGIGASVKSPGSAESISSHVSGADTRASGVGADRVRGRHRAVLRVLVVIEKYAVPLFLPPLAGGELGARRSTSRASASAARRTSSNVQRRSMRTLT